MTLVLRTFKELKKHFDSTITIMGAIDTLNEPRKSEVAYIQSILELVQDSLITKGLIKKDDLSEIITDTPQNKTNSKPNKKQLEQQIAHDQARKELTYYSSVCYGAMLFIIEDINKNLGRLEKLENSVLYKRLRDGMGIKENPLTPHQMTTCYQDFNKFLNYVFDENDSRKGFKEIHVLQFMELSKLVSWMQTSYTLEKDSYKKELKALIVEGETPVSFTSFKLFKEMSKILIEPYKSLAEAKDSCTDTSWKEMEASLNKLIDIELKTKHLPNLSELKAERRIPLQFLATLADCLSGIKIKPEDKIAILVGSMFLMRGKIAIEYKLSPLHKEIIYSSYTGKPIIVHNELSKLLHAENTSFQDMEVFLLAAHQFIEHLTLENKENVLGIKAKHLFSEIKGFNLKETLALAQTMICDSRTTSIQECLDATVKLTPKEKSSTSSWGIFGSKKKKEEEVENLDELFGENKIEDTAAMTI
jgi:hypothetical protein